MEVMFDRVAGLDVGKESVTVCLRTPGVRGRRHAETRTFKTTFGALRVMRDWLVEAGVSIAAMESTSTYWKPPFFMWVIGVKCRFVRAVEGGRRRSSAGRSGPWLRRRRVGPAGWGGTRWW